MCEDKPVVKTSYVDEEECEAVTREKCAPVTREECSQVVDKVPHQSTKEVSRIKSRLFIHYYFYFALYRSATLFMWKTVYKNIPKKVSKKQCLTKYVMKC